jgi:acetoacetyl-CoA synthetase
MGSASPENLELELWRHSDPKSTFMWEFKELISRKYDVELDSYEHLYNWSIDNISPFWDETWSFTGIKSSLPYSKVC